MSENLCAKNALENGLDHLVKICFVLPDQFSGCMDLEKPWMN